MHTSTMSAGNFSSACGIKISSPLRPSFIALFKESIFTSAPRTTAHRLIKFSDEIGLASKLIAAAREPKLQEDCYKHYVIK